jgi:uncharacterized protein YacL
VEREQKPAPRGVVVELTRLILVAVFTVGGWTIADASGSEDARLLTGILLGSSIGYVVGGILGRRTVTAMSTVEREFRKIPASELLAGVLGLILGLLVAVLASVLVFRLPPAAAYPTAAFTTLVLGYLGYRVGRAVNQELFALFGAVNVLDTSALIDGRVLEVVRAGFLGGTFLVPRGVLSELQTIADSSDPRRRSRGQRGLDVLRQLQRFPAIEVVLVEEMGPGDVDAQLVRLARDRGGVVVTSDANLAFPTAA